MSVDVPSLLMSLGPSLLPNRLEEQLFDGVGLKEKRCVSR